MFILVKISHPFYGYHLVSFITSQVAYFGNILDIVHISRRGKHTERQKVSASNPDKEALLCGSDL